jgi:hypothetical protein
VLITPACSERLRVDYFDLRIVREILRIEGEKVIQPVLYHRGNQARRHEHCGQLPDVN